MKRFHQTLWLFFLAMLVLVFACQRRPADVPEETILARVGDRTISREEFISRAEYTIRPPYCRGDDYIQRKIVLNSLIAEKLFALEAGEKNELSENEQFKLYLQGRKEQAMRQWLYYQDFYSKIVPDSAEQKRQFALAGRTYKMAYYSMSDSGVARRVGERLSQGDSFEAAFNFFGGMVTAIPRRDVAYSGPEPESLKDLLFAAPLAKGAVIGPVEIDKGLFTVMKVEGWTDRPAVSESDVQRRWQDVTGRLRERKAAAGYTGWVAGLMRGKTLRFDGQTFPQVVRVMGDFYLASDAEKKRLLKRQIWNAEDSSQVNLPVETLDEIAGLPFMVLDDEVWTVRDLQKLLLRHPLVFRSREIKKGEFAGEFRDAVADLVRDLAITEQAYGKGYDKVNLVQRNAAMWRDNLLSIYQRNRYLREKGREAAFYADYLKVIESDLDPYFRDLSKKYSDKIEINTDEFEKIQLTRIDMFATQRNVPFPVVAPSFPLLTTHSFLDYGRKLEAKK